MNRRWGLVPAVCAAAACAAGNHDRNEQRSSSRAEGDDAGAILAAPCVRVIDLGTFEGDSEVVAMNERGDALIREDTTDPQSPDNIRRRAFLWDGSTRTEITGFGAENVTPADINENGDIIVQVGLLGGPRRGYLLRNGTATALGAPPNHEWGDPIWLNDAEQIAFVATGSTFFWQSGTFQSIGAPTGDFTFPIGLTEDGRVVVAVFNDTPVQTQHSFLWDHATVTALLPPGAVNSEAVAMNASAHTVLRSDFAYPEPPGVPRKAFLWRDGTYVPIVAFNDESDTTYPLKVNDHEEVTGYLFTDAGFRAFFWHDRMTSEISIPHFSTGPIQIDNRGVVTGDARSEATLQDVAFAWKDGHGLLLENGWSHVTTVNQHGLVGGSIGRPDVHARIWDTSACFGGGADGGTPEPPPDAGHTDAGGKTW